MADEGPVKVGELLGAILAKYGYADLAARQELERAWEKTADERTRRNTRLGSLRRGMLEVLVRHSALLHELEGFQKEELTARMQSLLKPGMLKGLKFRKA